MPILLRKAKTELEKVPRKLTDYAKLSLVGPLDTKFQPGLKAVTFSGNIKSETDPTDMYRNTIQFFDVEYSDKDFSSAIKVKTEKDMVLPDGIKEGTTMFMRVPTVRGNGVRMKCSCPDFRFFFEKQLFDKNGLIGNWRRYKRKTPPTVRPANPKNPNPVGHDFKNPDNYLGMCKHLYSLLVYLKNEGLVKER